MYESTACAVIVEDVLIVSIVLVLLTPLPLHCKVPVHPLAVRLAVDPAHTVALVTCTVARGAVLTVIEATLVHPGLTVQVAEYTLLD